MTWWINKSSILKREKSALSELNKQAEWLSVHNAWEYNDHFQMQVDFEITHNNKVFALSLVYPNIFPDTVPSIITKEKVMISGHQYLSGELCLEYRPDTWNPKFTGADVIENAYKLICAENKQDGSFVNALSAHEDSLGRNMRGVFGRFITTPEILEFLGQTPPDFAQRINLRTRWEKDEALIINLESIGIQEPFEFTNLKTPMSLEADSKTGTLINIPDLARSATLTPEYLSSTLIAHGFTELNQKLLNTPNLEYLLIGNEDKWSLYIVSGGIGERTLNICGNILAVDGVPRLTDEYSDLAGLKVAIIGCGSVGSKIASSLCRSKLDNFLLIDEDIFLPDNLVRNDLDLRDIGIHKTKAVRKKLLNINPSCEVETRELCLGGQESGSFMTTSLEAIEQCDLIVDATVSPIAFNMLASVAKRSKIPMVWCQIFSGGIGGLIVRARPDIDPIPLECRDQIENWCHEYAPNVEEVMKQVRNYESYTQDGLPMVADDAEVSIISAHATRFVLDILKPTSDSIFSSSAYLIGMMKNWKFDQPFDVYPIGLSIQSPWGDDVDDISEKDRLNIVLAHTPKA